MARGGAIAVGVLSLGMVCACRTPAPNVSPEVASDAGEPAPSAYDAGEPVVVPSDKITLTVAAGMRFSMHSLWMLGNPDVTLAVCRDHFPVGSSVRTEIENAAGFYNAIAATKARIQITEDAHRTTAEFFASEPTVNRLDYVDTLAADYEGFPCHKKNEIACTDWTLNTCPFNETWGGTASGKAKFFNISINTNCFDQFRDPTSSSYPRALGVAHELGHGFGMSHTTEWPEDHRALLSTMQGTPLLGAHDYAYVRARYPAEGAQSDLTASPVIRWPATLINNWLADTDRQIGVFPKALYPDLGEWKDCKTREAPMLGFMWLNRGTTDLASVEGVLGLEDPPRAIVHWSAADMPAESQEVLVAQVSIPERLLSDLLKNVKVNLRYEVSARDESGVLASQTSVAVELRNSESECPGGGP